MLAEAIAATFARREPNRRPSLALSAAFAEATQIQWTAFLRRTDIALAPGTTPDIQAQIAALMKPPPQAVAGRKRFEARWAEGGPWRGAQSA